MRTMLQSVPMGNVIGALACSTASPDVSFVRSGTDRPNLGHPRFVILTVCPFRPQAAIPPVARAWYIARTGSACAICNNMAPLIPLAAKAMTITASFMARWLSPDMLGSCMYVRCLIRCFQTHSPRAVAAAQINTRSEARERYGIRGDTYGDCLTAWCCRPCSLTQERREIELEEGSVE